MGLSFWVCVLVLSLSFKHLASQQPNTDGFFLSEFFKNMGLSNSSQAYSFGSTPFCSWQGVVCDSQKEYVVELVVSGLGLSGSIPDTTIGKLSKLQYLDLSNNNITSLPSDFWSLGSLKNLNLSSNRISGSLPSNIGNFGLLEAMDLSNNNISGEIPAAISSLVSLRVLKLNNNGFQLSIPPDILRCQSLVLIDLSSNWLNGYLPVGFVGAFPKLRTLNLAGNQIQGTDSDFSDMNSIVSLNISGNLFQGSVLGFLRETVGFIDLSRNQFDGHISQVPSNSSYNWSNLIYLDLSDNRLSGDIFDNLSSAQKLRHLNLGNNRFSSQKFPRVQMLSALEYLNLSRTSLAGEIPSEILRLSNLSTLDLSSNNLTGNIPFLSIENLQVLDVSNNNLSGWIPLPILEKLPLMKRFNFSYNNLTLCSSKFSPETLETSFFGTTYSCPIAADPSLIKRRAKGNTGLKLALGLTFSIICLLAGLLLFLAFGCRRKSKTWALKQMPYWEQENVSGPFSLQSDSTSRVSDVKQAALIPVVIFDKPLLNITYADLLATTANFDRGNLLSEGKFGSVYRGLLPGGNNVAMKVLADGSRLTDQEAVREFEYLGRIKHSNLVPLAGYCIAGEQRIALYDYTGNGNLYNLLHDRPLGFQTTDDLCERDDANGIQDVGSEGLFTTWRFRHRIALGSARALAFLHHGCSPPIVHTDVKTSMICLDLNSEPRLSDSGLSKIFGNGLNDDLPRGSPGYMPPEFEQPVYESPTPKSDVYCFGVILFELITGKKPTGDDYPEEKDGNLVSWVRGLVRKNQGSRAIDPKIQDTGPDDQMVEALRIGYLCTADLPSKRPSMQQVVGLLKDIQPIHNH